MFYNNALYKFKLPDEAPETVAGSVLNASSMPAGQFMRRNFRRYPYLQHRVFDPQVYLATLDPHVARETVINLASWPWFASDGAPEYNSAHHGTLRAWRDRFENQLVESWRGSVPSDPVQIENVARECIQRQVALGCEAVILPGPLTTIATGNYELETVYLDLGLAACDRLQVNVPILGTVAISDNLLRGIPPLEHPLLHTISSQVAARPRLAGAYIVVEQANEPGYACTSRETVLALLLLADDLARGAAKSVYVNFAGGFGAVLTAVGARIWASGYYLSQRRLQLAHFDDERGGPAYPRLYSLRLAGDVGVERDVQTVFDSDLGERILTRTAASARLWNALAQRAYPASVPDWQYRPNNIQAAAAHYYEISHRLGAYLASLEAFHRIEAVSRWLEHAAASAEELSRIGVSRTHTDLVHQSVWLDAFRQWRNHARI